MFAFITRHGIECLGLIVVHAGIGAFISFEHTENRGKPKLLGFAHEFLIIGGNVGGRRGNFYAIFGEFLYPVFGMFVFDIGEFK